MAQLLQRKDPVFRLSPPPPEMELMWANTVIGKIIGDRDLSVAEVEDVVNNTCVKRADIQVSRVEDIFLFCCSNAQDREDLIQLENVVIMGVLLVLKRCNPRVPLKEWRFDDTALWVQIHGAPATHIISEVAVGLAQLVGQVMDVDLGGGKERGIMRVKVRIDLDRPVLPGAYLDAGEEGGIRGVSFHYENVCRLCKNCWRLGHLAKSCSVPVETAGANDARSLVFRPVNKINITLG